MGYDNDLGGEGQLRIRERLANDSESHAKDVVAQIARNILDEPNRLSTMYI